MLTEKDYCDYDTCVALKELGYSESFPLSKDYEVLGKDYDILLYEAQKWLREEKKIEANAFYENPVACWRFYILEIDSPDLSGTYAYDDAYMSYEEALLEGVRESVKLLKEEK